jgi:transposase-like protein
MSKLKSLEELFAGRHFDREGMCVRWYLRYKLSLSDLVEMMAERGIKSRTGPMLGFKNFNSAAITLAGVELLHRIRKEQFALSRLQLKDQAAPAIWNAVLAA